MAARKFPIKIILIFFRKLPMLLASFLSMLAPTVLLFAH
jgi:hypothetical protein